MRGDDRQVKGLRLDFSRKKSHKMGPVVELPPPQDISVWAHWCKLLEGAPGWLVKFGIWPSLPRRLLTLAPGSVMPTALPTGLSPAGLASQTGKTREGGGRGDREPAWVRSRVRSGDLQARPLALPSALWKNGRGLHSPCLGSTIETPFCGNKRIPRVNMNQNLGRTQAAGLKEGRKAQVGEPSSPLAKPTCSASAFSHSESPQVITSSLPQTQRTKALPI